MQIPHTVVSTVVVSLAVAGVVAIAQAQTPQTPATTAPPLRARGNLVSTHPALIPLQLWRARARWRPLLFAARSSRFTVRYDLCPRACRGSAGEPAGPAGRQRATNPPDRSALCGARHLIAKKDIPVTIGIFITPGQRGDTYPDTIGTGNPNNRAAEYDSLSNTYGRFLIEEMLPEVAKKYALATDPARRAIGGTSSGAICAFTVAWNFPDQFRNVISGIGSYTSIGYRPAANGQPMTPGGDLYPTLIARRRSADQDLMQDDGRLNNEHGTGTREPGDALRARVGERHRRHAESSRQPQINHVWGDGATRAPRPILLDAALDSNDQK